jgi:GDP-fucose transporter C1
MRRQSSPLESGEISPTNSSLYVAQIVIAYWSVSISMVYLNKFLLSSDEASIPAPLFLTWSQCFITCIICFIIGEIGGDSKTSDGWFSTFPKARYQLAQAKEIAPLSLIFVGMITFNQLCLKYVEVSFYSKWQQCAPAFWLHVALPLILDLL